MVEGVSFLEIMEMEELQEEVAGNLPLVQNSKGFEVFEEFTGNYVLLPQLGTHCVTC